MSAVIRRRFRALAQITKGITKQTFGYMHDKTKQGYYRKEGWKRKGRGASQGELNFCKEATIESSALLRLPAGCRFKGCFLKLL